MKLRSKAAAKAAKAESKRGEVKGKLTPKTTPRRVPSPATIRNATAEPIDRSSVLASMAESTEIFDAHCRYLSWRQQTEGIDALRTAMDTFGVGLAALTGCPFKKCWVENSAEPPLHHLHDDGDLYYYSMTDAIVWRDLQRAEARAASGQGACTRFLHLACGFNLGDRGCGDELRNVMDEFDVVSELDAAVL